MSLHQRILRDIEELIVTGRWAPGSRIPFEEQLAGQYNCSRMTVNKALTQLVAAGLIERRRKAGSFVRAPTSQSAVLEIVDIGEDVRRLGLDHAFTILKRQRRSASRADRRLIDLAEGEPLLALACLHYAGTTPFCLEDRRINLTAVPETADETFETLAPGAWLVSRVPWTSAEHRIRAKAADAAEAERLGIARGTPCLEIHRRTWSGSTPVTGVCLTFPGAGHELVARFAPGRG